MCGIFVSNDPNITNNQLDIIEKTLRFRGPDCSSGLIQFHQWHAYHSRLSIIDINSGINQPVLDNHGGMLIFNGEILNYRELGKKHFNAKYVSDTLLLSDLIANYKFNINELDGFFAFVYIDPQGIMTHCARDKFGVKPLFIYKNSDYITISSEPNTLKQLFKLEINTAAIEEYKAVRAPLFCGSYFKGVSTLAPGACFINGQYFDPIDYLNGEYREVTEYELKTAILAGIESRMVSDAKIGLLLSRGVDSHLLKELGNFNQYYSIGFTGDEDIEYLKSEHIQNLTINECENHEYRDEFHRLLTLRGEPMSVPNEVLLSKIARRAKQDGMKVLLSGEGADEFFGGYDRIYQWAHHSPSFDIDQFIELYCYTKPNKNSLLYHNLVELFEHRHFPNTFEAVRWFFIRYHLPILFRRLDFSLMAAGIEGREPLANIHTFHLATKISPTVLMGKHLGKMPLRNLIAPMKGNEFAFENKIGFPVDLTAIFKQTHHKHSYQIWFEENLKVLK
ncbi:asparagine synthetase B family protein [Shewanella surugensis]|uniref:asparagine synthase (glutamine-hydrolyzing) n=1 Tax=Shewanella surugensis TaxID=212020 RepID=A0ABT0LC28_9GAMM|nr:asparagine synthase-related protein [Shewanella surugensis]MCL1124915.1 asparagine synthetase B [Shewanella surugensis]